METLEIGGAGLEPDASCLTIEQQDKSSGIPALLVLCVGMVLGQDTAHDVDKGATKTGHFVKHAGKRIGHVTTSGVEDAGHGTKVVAKDSAKGVKKTSKKTGEGIKDAASK